MTGILFLHSSADLYGSDKSLLRMVTALDKNIFQPHVILPCEGPLVKKFRDSGIPVGILDMGIWRRRHATRWGIATQVYHSLRAMIHLRGFVRAQHVRLIVSNTLAVVVGGPLARVTGIRHVWYAREIVESPRIVVRALAFLLLHFSNSVVAVSQAVRKHWESAEPRLAGKVSVISNGMELPKGDLTREDAREKLGLCPSGLIIGMVGRINRMKGHLVLLEIARKILTTNPDAYFICLGGVASGEEWRREELIAQIVRAGLENRFLLRDFSEDTHGFYRAVDVVAVCSTQPDSFPGVCIEAGLAQRPVVAFDIGGIAEIVQNGRTGIVVPSGDQQAFALALQGLLSDSALRERLGCEAKETYSENFPLSRQTAQLQELFLKQIGSAP